MKILRLLLAAIFVVIGTVYAQNIMIIENAQVNVNNPVTVNFAITNAQTFTAFQTDILIPSGFSYVGASAALNPARLPSPGSHSLSATYFPGTNTLRLLCFSMTNALFTGNSGPVVYFTLNTPANAPGVYPVNITSGIISNTAGVNIMTGSQNGTVTLNTNVVCPANAAVCIDAVPFALTGGTPAGGVYTGTGVQPGYIFNPALAGAGVHTITYTYTYPNLVAGSCNYFITVNPVPAAVAGTDRTICLNQTTQLGAAPVAGSSYSWSSVPAGFTSTAANPPVSPAVTTIYTVTETVDATGCFNTNSVTVTVNPIPPANAGTDQTICLGQSAQIGATQIAGNTYSWSSVPVGFTSTSSNPTVSPVETTIYTLTETVAATGCSNSHSVTVTVNPLPAANAGNDDAICLGESTQIGAPSVSGSTYLWSSIPAGYVSTEANPTVSPVVTTIYTLIETITATGCSNTNSVTITVNPLPAANAGVDDAICLGESTQIGAPSVSGSTYLWSSIPAGYVSTEAHPTVSPVVTTIYTLIETITATGCSNTNSVTVTVNPLPAANAGNDDAICLGESTQIGAPSVSGSTYLWSSIPAGYVSTEANPTVSPVVTTIYTLIETITATGCSNTNSVTITVNPLPAANAGNDDAICLGESAQIGAPSVSGSTFLWSSIPAGFVSTDANPTVSPVVTTIYTLIETITATGCSNTNSITVTVNPLPAANAGNDDAICLGESTQIGAPSVSGSTYLWSSSPAGYVSTEANPTVSPVVTTIYTLIETITATGCSNTNSVTVTVNPLPAANTGSDQEICSGESIEIGGPQVSGNTYSWTSVPSGFTSTSSNPTVRPVETTVYTLIETITATGCSNTNSVTITVNPLPVANAGADRDICLGESTQIGATAVTGSTYLWSSDPSGFVSTEANPTVTPVQTTTYTLIETITATGCSNTNSVIVTVNPLPEANAGADRAICIGESTQIGATPVAGSTYQWTSNPVGFASTEANPVVSPVVTTTYTVTETVIATGCTNTNDVLVVVNPLPNAFAGADRAICLGESTQIGAASVPGSTYLWSSFPSGFVSTQANPTVTPVQTTTYTLIETITATGCSNTNQVVVTVNPLPAANAGVDRAICLGESTQLGTDPVSGNTYSWISVPSGFTSTSANPVVTPLVSTTYTLTETVTATGCFNTHSVNVTVNPLPVANAGSDRTICQGISTQIGAAPVVGSTYMWTSIPAGFTSTEANPTVSPLVTTTYTLIETITATGCSNTRQVVVTVNPIPDAETGVDRAICLGESTQLGAPPVTGNTYAWSSVPVGFTSTSSNPTVTPVTTTTYTLIETITATGCSNTNSVQVTVNQLPSANAGADRAICLGESTQLGALPVTGNTYAWSSVPVGFTSTSANPTVTPLETTTYTLIETVTATGCSNTGNVLVTVNPVPEANAGADRAICLGESTQLGAPPVSGNTYSWSSVPVGFTSTSSDPTVSPLLTTTYTLLETITGTGCSNLNSVLVTVNPLPAADAGPDRAICLGESTRIGALPVSGSTYSWTSVPAGFTSTEANPTVSPVVTTIYTVIETITATGCYNTNSVTVTVNPLPAANAGTDRAICLGASTVIGAPSVSGSSYLWTSIPAGFTSTEANPTVNPLVTTIYTLLETYTATGCSNTHSVTVTVNPLPAAIAGADRAICLGQSTQLGAAPVSGSTYVWSSNPAGFSSTEANPTVSPVLTTTYTVIETITATGCSNTHSVIVTVNPLPAAIAGADRAICLGQSTQLGALPVAGSTYVWSSNPAGFTSTEANPTVSPVVTTTYTVVETITATGCTNSHSVVVTVNPLPSANAGVNRAICLGQSTQIGATPVTGNTYSWTSVPVGFTSTSANPTVNPVVTTTYTLVETIAATGCSNSNNVVVTVNPLPAAIAGTDRAICLGQTTQLGALPVAGSTYLWSSNPAGFTSTEANPMVSPVVTTTYTVIETITATGCSNTHSVIVTVNPLPAAVAGADRAICIGASTQLGAAPVAGSTYSWTSVPAGFTSTEANPTVSPLVTTTYTITETVTGTGCSNSNSVIVTVNPLPAAAAGIPQTICEGENALIGAPPVAGSTYSWSSLPAGFSSTESYAVVNPLVTTIYTVTETITATGCSNSNSVIITVNPLPPANAGTNSAICIGSSVQIGASPIPGNTYSWSSVPAGFVSNIANPVVSPLVTTVYTLVETVTASGCSNSNFVVVTVNPLPNAIAGDDRSICYGESTQLGTQPVTGSTYSWTSNPAGFTSTEANPIVNPLVTTTYTVVETITATGCTNSNSVVVTVNPLPAANAGADRAICLGESTQIGAAPVAGNTYLWISSPIGFSSTESNPMVSPAVTTTYILVETITATGCSNTNSVIVTVNPLPAANAGADRAICLGGSTQLGAAPVPGNTYSWTSNPAGFTATDANPTVSPLVTTTYTLVETITATGCSNSHSVIVTVNPLPAAVAGANRAICIGASTQIGAAPVTGNTYSWTSTPAGFTSTEANPTVSPLVTTTYTLVETITATGCSNTNNVIVTVNPLPVPTITGAVDVCFGATGVTYTTESGMTGYIWTVSAGGTISAGQGTGSIQVTWNIAGPQTVSVNYTNANGCTATSPSVLNVDVKQPFVVGSIAANQSICFNTAPALLTGTAPSGGMQPYAYQWFSSTDNVNFVAITGATNLNYQPGILNVTTYYRLQQTSAIGCGTFNTNVVTITVNPLPVPTITGPATACTNQAPGVYTTEAGMTGYIWTISVGGTIVSGAGTNAISVVWNAPGPQTVSVNYTDANGCTAAAPVVKNVTVNASPVPNLNGVSVVCAGTTGVAYSTDPGMNNYIWTISSGGTITSGQGSNAVFVTWNTAGIQTISVNYTSPTTGCSAASPTVKTVTVNPLPVPTITGPNSVCVNSSGHVYTTQAGMTQYTWTVSAGGTITSGAASNAITVTWSAVGPQTVSVNYYNANGCTAVNPTVYNVTVNPLPVPTITGPNSVCKNATNVVYTTQTGMTNYVWTVSSGGTITAGGTPTSNSVTVTWHTTGLQAVTVGYTNSNGCTSVAPTSYSVNVNPLPVPTIGSNNTPCVGSSGNMYYTESGMTGYVWTVSAGGTIISGQGTSAINVTWNTAGAQSVSVNYSNSFGCTAAVPTVYNLFVTPVPAPAAPITGTASVCAGTNGVAYSTTPVTNATSYTWTVPAGASIASGQGTTNITVNFGSAAVSGNVTVAGTNSCGNGTPSSFAVTVNPLPAAAGTITGPASVCAGTNGVNYSVPAIANATSYGWTVPAGMTIVSGANTNSIIVNVGLTPGTGVITVKGTNACGSGTPSPNFNVTINGIPDAPVVTANGNILTSSSPVGNQWYYEGVAIPGATGQTYVVTHNTGYYWCIVTINGCSSGISNKVWIEIVGVPELPQEASFLIYPVPNDGQFNVAITYPGEDTFTMTVYNQIGMKVYQKTDLTTTGGRYEARVDMRPVANGVYSVVFTNKEHKVIKKIIVKH